MFTFYICLFILGVGWDQGVFEYQALIWRSENDLGESVSPSTMWVQGNLTPDQWQLSVLTGPSCWCTVWFWRQGLTVVQDGLSWTGWLQPPSSCDCRHHYYTQIATWYFSQRSKRRVQHREHWRALCLVTGTTLPWGPGVLFEFVLPVNNTVSPVCIRLSSQDLISACASVCIGLEMSFPLLNSTSH